MSSAILDDVTVRLVELAAAIAAGDEGALQSSVARAVTAGVPALAVDELVLQSVLTVGWPRALVAAGIWRTAIGAPAQSEAGDLDYECHQEWARRGEATCRIIYGEHYDKLRTNVRALHPALEVWMVTEGYGRTLARPGLALAIRELCTVAQTAVLRTPRQLHSHLLGALRSGASVAEIEETLQLVRPWVPDEAWREASVIWQRVRLAPEGAK
ncbi:MAG TPA: carboxymuconolactone decarboxylase family protein [Gemmatimonadales bacterium]